MQGTKKAAKELRPVGWREWVTLPDLGVKSVKAKVDTGARTSSLHAFDLEVVSKKGKPHVRFSVHPLQHDTAAAVRCEVPVLEQRWIRSSNGKREYRPVIKTLVGVGDEQWPIELTLTSRDLMGFRMLLGREALRRRVMVDAGRSFLMGHAPTAAKKKPKSKKKAKKGKRATQAEGASGE